MKVLFATHDYPFPISYGGQVYSGNVIKELAKLVDSFSVVAFDKDVIVETRKEAHGAQWTLLPLPLKSNLTQLINGLPKLAVLHQHDAYWQVIRRELVEGRPDFLIVDYIAIGWILPRAIKLIAEHNLPTRTLYMSHNVETLLRQQIAANYKGSLPMRLLARFDAARAGALEKMLCEMSDIVSVETIEDAESFRKLFAPRDIVMAPPGYAGEIIQERTIDDSVPRALCVLGGRLSTMKQLVLDELLVGAAAGIHKAGVAFHVIGPMSSTYQAETTLKYPDVTVHGFVDDVAPVLSCMRAGIVADHVGGGFKHRILTYVFYRVPMIALPEAMAGLPLTPGEDYYPINSYNEVPRAVQAIIDDVALLDRFQNRAFERCAQAFSWHDTMVRLAADLAERKPG